MTLSVSTFKSLLNFKGLCNQGRLLHSQSRGLNAGGLPADVALHRCEHLSPGLLSPLKSGMWFGKDSKLHEEIRRQPA